ncbi:Response regulator protein vraR [Oligella ureolytica]|uniref:Response regulator protein vraR n=2 Tax=Oligella ureolytica TaxID=90244 RepID=A0A378XFR7_9BURK|nr:response regulator transcription factor [Oligella ureolytica]QPT41125.1 response regulator transcription factor [Oligella ureolytica]SUA53775.1 Response regulator protein vraR [Oligella ureolytica]
MVKILLIDDHTLFRSGLKSLIQREAESRYEVVAEAADGLEGVKMMAKYSPDIILLDLSMPVMNGKETLQQIMNINPEQVVLMLTVSEDATDLTECMQLGAKGFLLKNIEADFLLESIDKALNGDTVFSPEMTQKLLNQIISTNAALKSPQEDSQELNANQVKIDQLTNREREILAYIAAGESNKQIARSLDVAENTVKVHVQNVLKKLEVNSRVQAAVIAVQFNIQADH